MAASCNLADEVLKFLRVFVIVRRRNMVKKKKEKSADRGKDERRNREKQTRAGRENQVSVPHFFMVSKLVCLLWA
jgi:hypothetical protein